MEIEKNITKYYCECCDYLASCKQNFYSHKTTRKHQSNSFLNQMEITGNQKEPQKCYLFVCELCNFENNSKQQYDKHLITKKHCLNVLNKKNVLTNVKQNCCDKCDKTFVNASGLWKHKKKCQNILSKNEEIEEPKNSSITSEMFMEFMKKNNELQLFLYEQNKELQNTFIEKTSELQNTIVDQNNKIIELSSKQTMINSNNTNSNNNNNFNLQFFLNETCKDALNITDFINSLQLSVKDFETTGRIGYVEGISRIIINGLKQIDTNKRPVHCTDLKRETVYVKHENEWEKENPEKNKLKWAVNRVAQMNLGQLPNWQLENPECANIDTRQNENLIQYSLAALGGQYKDEENKFMDKIMKNVLKEVIVDKNIS